MSTLMLRRAPASTASLYPSKTALEAAFAVARKAKIPQMPDVVMALRQEVSRPEPDLMMASGLIAQDLAITGRLLQTINSPAFNRPNKITSVQQAAALMGAKRLSNLVSAEAINQMLEAKQPPARVVWESIIEEARQLSAISHLAPSISDDEAYLFGVMHDIGCLIFTGLNAEYGAMWSLNSNSTPSELLAFERRAMRSDHTVIGFLLARHWQLPDYIGVAIHHHHTPGLINAEDPKVNQLVALSKLAHYLVALSQGTEELPEMQSYREDAWHALDIGEREWAQLCEGTVRVGDGI
jgi:HD-like signal output (HDOD) protein